MPRNRPSSFQAISLDTRGWTYSSCHVPPPGIQCGISTAMQPPRSLIFKPCLIPLSVLCGSNCFQVFSLPVQWWTSVLSAKTRPFSSLAAAVSLRQWSHRYIIMWPRMTKGAIPRTASISCYDAATEPFNVGLFLGSVEKDSYSAIRKRRICDIGEVCQNNESGPHEYEDSLHWQPLLVRRHWHLIRIFFLFIFLTYYIYTHLPIYLPF